MQVMRNLLLLCCSMYALCFPYPPPRPHCPPGQVLEIVVFPAVGKGQGGDFCTSFCNATADCPAADPYNASVNCSGAGTCEMRCVDRGDCPAGADCVQRRAGGGMCLY
jgi:hypothetical protein